MKKNIYLFVFFLAVLGCQDILRFDSNLQAVVQNDELFRAAQRLAFIQEEDGRLIIEGTEGDRRLTFSIATFDREELALGGATHDIDIATYQDRSGNIFTTDTPQANGTLNLRFNGDNSISGEFNFLGFNIESGDSLVLNRGFVFNIPIESEAEEEIEITENMFEATVNTIPFEPNFLASGNNGLSIISAQTNITTIILQFPPDIAIGEHPLLLGTDVFGSYTVQGETSFSTEGTLIIDINEQDFVMGSFDFTTSADFNIVGTFSINF